MKRIKFKIPDKIARYPKQMAFIKSAARYNVVEATTKAGKTVGCIVWLYKEACDNGGPGKNFWWVAPISATAKIAFRRMKRFITPKSIFVANNSEMTLTLANGSTIFFKSADNPDSLYGEDVHGAVIDEATRTSKETWTAVRSTVTATGGKIKIIGNVKGIDNWVYELARKAEAGELEGWEYHKITAADAVAAGIFPQSEIDDAERSLPKEVFLELYFAIPFVNSSNKFAFSFDEKKTIGKTTYNPKFPLYISFDFNKNPICASVFQAYDKKIFGIETIKLPNSNIYKLCEVIRVKYPRALIVVNGDATGRATTALTKDNLNYYQVIKQSLRLSDKQIQVPTINPPLDENQLLVNAILEKYAVILDRDNMQPLINDLKFVEMLADGTIKKGDRNDPNQQADALDTFRYFLNANFKWFLKAYSDAMQTVDHEDRADQETIRERVRKITTPRRK